MLKIFDKQILENPNSPDGNDSADEDATPFSFLPLPNNTKNQNNPKNVAMPPPPPLRGILKKETNLNHSEPPAPAAKKVGMDLGIFSILGGR